MTDIAVTKFSSNSLGNVSYPPAWPWTDVINKAHTNGVKIIMTVTNSDKNSLHKILISSSVKLNLIKNIKSIIETYKLDGVNIDFEGLYLSDRGTLINNFMKELTDSIHSAFPGKEVSFAAPHINWSGWNFKGLAASCDYIFIMGYSYYGKSSPNAGPTAPLIGGSHNITNTILVQYASVNPDKLILGVPYFGNHWETYSPYQGAAVEKYVGAVPFESAEASAEVYGKLWSTTYQTPWYRWKDGNYWNQVWYDDDSSLGMKYDFAIAHHLKGIGIWALGYDGDRQELWNEINLKFGNGKLLPPVRPQQLRIIAQADSVLEIMFEIPKSAVSFKIFKSMDGLHFTDSVEVTSNDIIIKGLSPDSIYYFRVKALNSSGESNFTELLSAVPKITVSKTLIVNGFDRVTDTTNHFDFIRFDAEPVFDNGYPFSSTSNEAVFEGKVSLSDYNNVIWILGDESTADQTFNQFEQDSVKSFLENGGNLFVSGSEIGYGLDRSGYSSSEDISFYKNYLKAEYINDAPEGKKAYYYSAQPIGSGIFEGLSKFNFDDGTHGTIDVDWPDAIAAINGSKDVLQYVGVPVSQGVAGISFSGMFPNGKKGGKLVYLAFPFETIYPANVRIAYMKKVFDFFETPVSVVNNENPVPTEFKLYQNYPNPFNPSTIISFILPGAGNAKIIIYNSIGEEIKNFNFNDISKGNHKIVWNGINEYGMRAASGMYIYTILFNSQNGETFRMSRKMILLK
ncbi:MAG TPA: T9SS type A sorting domain-containing protein [Ignavibacteria bacterium]|nr:T9SS type A sorting domain-containing protein [Ignavibacteria bacterium]